MESSATETSDTLAVKSDSENSGPPPRVEPTAENLTPVAAPAPTVVPCPRCGGKLTNPEGLGWCPSCGYCRSLDEGAGKTAVAVSEGPRKPSALGVVEFFEVLGKLPFWLWVLVGGTAVVAAVSVAADNVLPDESLARAFWSSIQVATGLVGLFIAQVWAFLLIAPESEHISAKDLILSARLWTMTCRRLPQSQRQVWLGGWSVATVLSAIFLVGGFSYWYQFYHPKKIADKGLIQAIANAASKNVKNKSLEESIEDFANSQDLTKEKGKPKNDKEKVKEDTRPTQDCVILGYTVERDRERRKDMMTSLVVATLVGGKLSYAGVVKKGIQPRASDELLARLKPLTQDDPFLPLNMPGVIWVRPKVFCEIRQSGFDVDGRLRDPNFKDLLTEQ